MYVRQQALLLLNDIMHRRENLATALREGIVLVLIGLGLMAALLFPRLFLSSPDMQV